MVRDLVDAVIFDLDGTLVDSAPGIEYSATWAWTAVQPGPPCPPLRPLIGPPIREVFRLALPEADATILLALEHAFRSSYDSEGWQKTVVYPGVPKVLTTLTALGVQCFGVTNKPSLPTQRILEHCGLQTYFRAFLSPDSVTPPHASKAEAVEALLAQYDLDPARTLFMGDTTDDARAAHASGLRFAAFTGGYGQVHQQKEAPVALVCAEFADVLKLVQLEVA
jgi:phosphoglycolate phosphatase